MQIGVGLWCLELFWFIVANSWVGLNWHRVDLLFEWCNLLLKCFEYFSRNCAIEDVDSYLLRLPSYPFGELQLAFWVLQPAHCTQASRCKQLFRIRLMLLLRQVETRPSLWVLHLAVEIPLLWSTDGDFECCFSNALEINCRLHLRLLTHGE